MSPILRSLVLALLLPVAQAAAATDPEDAEQLMRESALWQQLGSVAPSMRSGLLHVIGERGKPGFVEIEKLTRAIDAAYGADRLRPIARQAIAEHVSARHLDAIHGWYASPTGIAVSQAEVRAAGDRREPAAIVQVGKELLARTPPPRRDLLRALMTSTRANETAASIIINTAMALQRGASIRNPGLPGLSEKELQDQLEAQRPRLEEAMAATTLAMYAVMYQQLGDEEISAYVAFAKSEAGSHFADVCIRALNAALLEAGVKLGRALGGSDSEQAI